MHHHDHAEAQVSGLLADRALGFAAYLAGRGYAKSSVEPPGTLPGRRRAVSGKTFGPGEATW